MQVIRLGVDIRQPFVDFSQQKGEVASISEALLLMTQSLFHQLHRVRDGTLPRAEFQTFARNLASHIEWQR